MISLMQILLLISCFLPCCKDSESLYSSQEIEAMEDPSSPKSLHHLRFDMDEYQRQQFKIFRSKGVEYRSRFEIECEKKKKFKYRARNALWNLLYKCLPCLSGVQERESAPEELPLPIAASPNIAESFVQHLKGIDTRSF